MEFAYSQLTWHTTELVDNARLLVLVPACKAAHDVLDLLRLNKKELWLNYKYVARFAAYFSTRIRSAQQLEPGYCSSEDYNSTFCVSGTIINAIVPEVLGDYSNDPDAGMRADSASASVHTGRHQAVVLKRMKKAGKPALQICMIHSNNGMGREMAARKGEEFPGTVAMIVPHNNKIPPPPGVKEFKVFSKYDYPFKESSTYVDIEDVNTIMCNQPIKIMAHLADPTVLSDLLVAGDQRTKAQINRAPHFDSVPRIPPAQRGMRPRSQSLPTATRASSTIPALPKPVERSARDMPPPRLPASSVASKVGRLGLSTRPQSFTSRPEITGADESIDNLELIEDVSRA